MELTDQLLWLFILSLPVAAVSWTVTHEEIFREPREYCVRQYETAQRILRKKFFYVFTCEYCFSYYVTALFLVVTHFKMLFDDWRGYLVSGFAIIWVANVYMSLFALIRTDLKKERIVAKQEETRLEEMKSEAGPEAKEKD
jgi:hypothetical protein